VGGERAGNGRGAAAHIDSDFAFGIKACEIVVMAFGGAQAVADEDETAETLGAGSMRALMMASEPSGIVGAGHRGSA
jgi:hypothetical protein